MKHSYSRRHFVKISGINAIGIGIAGNVPFAGQYLLLHGQVQKGLWS